MKEQITVSPEPEVDEIIGPDGEDIEPDDFEDIPDWPSFGGEEPGKECGDE